MVELHDRDAIDVSVRERMRDVEAQFDHERERFGATAGRRGKPLLRRQQDRV